MTVLRESWSSFEKPKVSVKNGYNNVTKSIIIIEPLARGFGNTIGNAMRRILLSSIGGFAVTAVRINGVSHEYNTINGVREDVLDIIMNIKSLAIHKDSISKCTLKLSANKSGPVYAGVIETPSGVEILNKDLLICSLNKGAKIDIQMDVEYGRGYVVSDVTKKSISDIENPIGNIFIDAIFNPVKKVSYKVENARVGQVTDYDRLIIEIDTNGAVSPQDSLGITAKILQEQLQVFVNFNVAEEPMIYSRNDSIRELEFNKNLLKTIDELELSVRSYNCLKNENVSYVGDLVSKTEAEMLKMANFGRKSLNELKENLKGMNLSFGMKLVHWPPKNMDELLKLKNKEF